MDPINNDNVTLAKKAAEIVNLYYDFYPVDKIEKIPGNEINKYLKNYDKYINIQPLGKDEGPDDIFKSVFTKIVSETEPEGISLSIKTNNGKHAQTIVSMNKDAIQFKGSVYPDDKESLKTTFEVNLFQMFLQDALKKTNELIDRYNNKKGGKRRSTKKKRKSTKNRSSRQ